MSYRICISHSSGCAGHGYAIYRGVTTGFNEAFIIDNQTKEALIAKDPRSADIIKPVLRGRDIRRYQAKWAGMWLITTFPALSVNIDDYPAVKKYLLSFGKARLEQSGRRLSTGGRARKKTGNAWYELQDTCAYHEDFSKEKLFYMDLTEQGRFAYDKGELFCVNTAFMMSGQSIKYLCALLNSALITWFMGNTALNSGMGVPRWIFHTVERLPIPNNVAAVKRRPFIRLVNEILEAKSADANADTSKFEERIDQFVFELYGLTEDEVNAIIGY